MTIKSIMIIDDNETEHFINEAVIHDYDENIEIYKAYDGKEAIELLSSMNEQPSLILLDINMPCMGGLEFLEKYNDLQKPKVIVALLSSSEQEKDKNEAFEYNFVKKYVIKPLSIEHLKEIAKLEI